MKLSKTTAQNSFEYSWLLARIFPYIKPYLFRIFLGFLVAIPLGLLDGVTAFALKPFMDYVVGQHDWIFHIFGKTYSISYMMLAAIIPFGVVLFAAFQGVMRYLMIIYLLGQVKRLLMMLRLICFINLYI